MSDFEIPSAVVEKVYEELWPWLITSDDRLGALKLEIRRALGLGLRELGLREVAIECNCSNGQVENGPPGATYTVACDRCGGSGYSVQLRGFERPMQKGEAMTRAVEGEATDD